jgi:hypothetical protein
LKIACTIKTLSSLYFLLERAYSGLERSKFVQEPVEKINLQNRDLLRTSPRAAVTQGGFAVEVIGLALAPGVAGNVEVSVKISAFRRIHLIGAQIGNSGLVQGQNPVEFFGLHMILLFFILYFVTQIPI